MQLTLIIPNSGIGVFAQLPAQGDIVAKFQYAISSGNDQWIDTNATGNYEVEEGHSWLADGTAYGDLASAITITGDFTIKFDSIVNSHASHRCVIGGDSTVEGFIRLRSDTFPQVFINNAGYTFSTVALLLDTQYSHDLTRSGTDLTWTATDSSGNIQTETLTCLTNDLIIRYVGKWSVSSDEFSGNLYDLRIEDNTGVVLSNFLAQDNLTGIMESEVGPAVEFVNGTFPIVEKSVEFGHEWSNYSEYTGEIHNGHEVHGKVPADPANSSQDIFGNPLTNPGTPQKNMKVTGYTGAWDGGPIGNLSTPLIISGDFVFKTLLSTNNIITNKNILGGDEGTEGLFGSSTVGQIRMFIDNNQYNFTNLQMTVQAVELLTISRVGSVLTATLGSTKQVITGVSIADMLLRYIGTSTAGLWAGTIEYISIMMGGILTNHWVCESSPTSLQDIIYDIVGGNHATLTNATLPFFTTEMEGSKLFADGFDDVGGSTGLVPARADGLSALGQPLTNTPAEFIDDYCLFDAPLSVSFYDAAVVAGIEDDLYLAGAAIGLTADAWILLASNPLFFGAVKNILVMYNDTQSGDTLDQINDYLGI